MKEKTLYATQGGGYAVIHGKDAFFTETLDVPGAYHFNAGEKVPEQ